MQKHDDLSVERTPVHDVEDQTVASERCEPPVGVDPGRHALTHWPWKVKPRLSGTGRVQTGP